MSRHYLWLALLIIAGTIASRIAQWELRPFHTDEAVQAFQTWKLIKGEGYRYDPTDKHGPSLYYGTQAVAKIFRWDPALLEERNFRAISLSGGVCLIMLLLACWRRYLGEGTTLIGSLFIAIAPLTVLYHTYFVQEAWFCLFSWLLLDAALRYCGDTQKTTAVWIGIWAGAMQVTKETSVLHFATIAFAVAVARREELKRILFDRRRLKCYAIDALLVFTVAGIIYTIFYTSFFTHSAGLLDGITTYFHYADRAEGAGHAAPWHAYLGIFLPHVREGVRWGELSLLLAAGIGVAHIVLKRSKAPHIAAAAYFSISLFALYSAIPYKTPWLLLTPYVGLCLIAGYGITETWRTFPNWPIRIAITSLCAAVAAELFVREQNALHRFAGDARVPYFYQQTSPQFPLLVQQLESERKKNSGHTPSVLVCSPDHAWPLPWYLRNWDRVGYYTKPPESFSHDIVLADSRLNQQDFERLLRGQPAEPHGLRPNVLLWLTRRQHPPAKPQP